MKKLFSLIAVITILFTMSSVAFATNDASDSIEYFSDGSYIIITLNTENSISTYATNTKTGTKDATYYDSDGNILWKATLRATFTYTGSSATCTNAEVVYSTYNTAWKNTSKSATKSGNTATGNVTFKRYVLGIPVETIDKTITMTCSASGVIS